MAVSLWDARPSAVELGPDGRDLGLELGGDDTDELGDGREILHVRGVERGAVVPRVNDS